MLPPYPAGGTLSGGMDSSTICCLADGVIGEKESGCGSRSEKLKISVLAGKMS